MVLGGPRRFEDALRHQPLADSRWMIAVAAQVLLITLLTLQISRPGIAPSDRFPPHDTPPNVSGD